MKIIKVNNPYYHIAYWILIISILAMIFGRSWSNASAAFFFICLLLPVIMATSYFFNYYLVPGFLLKKKYFQFVLYFIYMGIISVFLEMLVLTITFIFILDYHLDRFSPNASDTLLLAIIMYLSVFLGSFILMVKQLNDSQQELTVIKSNTHKLKKSFLHIVSQRKSVKIDYSEINYIESLSDYIMIHLRSEDTITSKEKISKIENQLPDTFLRIHRSFIINMERISSFNYDRVEIANTELNIGRTYKKRVLQVLKTY